VFRKSWGPYSTVGVVNAESDMVPAKPLLVRAIVEEMLAPGRIVKESGLAVIEKSGRTVTEIAKECDREAAFPLTLRV
jgi:hypothetical protein